MCAQKNQSLVYYQAIKVYFWKIFHGRYNISGLDFGVFLRELATQVIKLTLDQINEH